MKIKFTKISATGNDFILIDNRNDIFSGDEYDFFQKICQRRLSVGADGILLLNNSSHHDFSLVYYNSDGHIGEMCGNGARAASFYAFNHGISSNHVVFDVLGVLYEADVGKMGVTLFMPPPVEIKQNIGAVEESFLEEGGFLNVGVPHYVLFAKDVDNIDIYTIGKKYRYHTAFQPWGTNTNFVQITGNHSLKMRTYERGVEEETLACGTGTISSAILANKQKGVYPPIEVEARGGKLTVNFNSDLSHITLTGEVQMIYNGEMIDE